MVTTLRPALVAIALFVAFAPLAYAEEGTASTTASTTVKTTRFEESKKFDEMLAKYRAMLDKKKGQFDSKVEKMKSKWEKGTSVATVDAVCVQKAVDVREVALQTAFSKSNASVMDALKARQTALYAAWGKTEVNVRNVALKDAWKAWTDARKAAAKALKTERETAFKAFKTTMKDTCKTTVPSEDASAGTDTAGQVTI